MYLYKVIRYLYLKFVITKALYPSELRSQTSVQAAQHLKTS